MNEVIVFPGDTTAEDWDDRRFWFWKVDDHGREGIARTVRVGLKRTDHIRYIYCQIHHSWEPQRRRITGQEALAWVLDRARDGG